MNVDGGLANGVFGAEGYGHSPTVASALNRLWATMSSDYGLVPQLAYDAIVARIDNEAETALGAVDDEEMRRCTPRLANMLVDYELTVAQAVDVVERLAAARWSEPDRALLVELLDGWWYEVLQRLPGEHHGSFQPDDVLGLLARSGAPMIRWLHVWLDELDGPGAVHLAEAVIGGLSGPSWHGLDDERGQVLAWARTETVVNGLALIGATHLDGDTFSRVMDVLIPNGDGASNQ